MLPSRHNRLKQELKRAFGIILSMTISLSCANASDTRTIEGAVSQFGKAIQGGLIIAQLKEGGRANLDGTPLPMSASGYVAFGFHRDDQETMLLEITYASGELFQTKITPQIREYETQSISGLAKNYVSPPQETLDRIARDRDAVISARAHLSYEDDFAKSGFDWPAKGIITGVYGSQRILNGQPRAPHYGIDIAAAKGTPVLAPADGIITMADDLYYTGGTIIIDHGLNISSTMLHLESMSLSVGDIVERGQVIGTVGSSGRSTGPHMDWRINWQQKRLDPQLALTLFDD